MVIIKTNHTPLSLEMDWSGRAKIDESIRHKWIKRDILFIFSGAKMQRCNSNNPRPYDPNKEVCCDGRLHPKWKISKGIRQKYACCTRKGIVRFYTHIFKGELTQFQGRLLFHFFSTFWKIVCSKRKEFAPKFFTFRVGLFSEGTLCVGKPTGSHKRCLPLKNGWKSTKRIRSL